MNNVLEILFNKCEEEIVLSKEEQEKILQEPKIYLQDIIDKINNENVALDLLRYEEQQNKVNAVYSELFYKRGFKDALSLH